MPLKFVIPAMLVAILAVGPASAEKVVFHYSAGELASPDGAEALYKRVEARAKSACKTFGRTGLWARRAAVACEGDLVADLVDKIGDERLETVHETIASRRYSARD